MGFLDYDGLLHFWQSIKTKFATKAEVDERINGKADASHTHAMADVTGLQAALDAKASTGTATTSAAGLMSAADKSKLDGIGAETASEVSALGTRMDDAESSIAELAKRLPIYYYTDVPSESSITEKPQLAVIKGGAVYLVE